MKTYRLTVHGLVQGVFFRKYTREKALELGLSGTVRNLENSSVEIEVTGTESVLPDFILWCHQGPARARVDKVDIHELPLKNFSDFRIIR
ncbi:MAG TPA: acylphosphatase [Bacteroidia bacterium]|nr:acylphosphatase [Bacteroidia bacterium]